MNIDAPASFSESVPVVQSSAPLSAVQSSIVSASAKAKAVPGGGDDEEESEDWDSEVKNDVTFPPLPHLLSFCVFNFNTVTTILKGLKKLLLFQ